MYQRPRTRGATPNHLFFLVTLPEAVRVISRSFASGLIYAMFRVIGGEIVCLRARPGPDAGLRRVHVQHEQVMALVLVLAGLGATVTPGMTWLERRLLRWQSRPADAPGGLAGNGGQE